MSEGGNLICLEGAEKFRLKVFIKYNIENKCLINLKVFVPLIFKS